MIFNIFRGRLAGPLKFAALFLVFFITAVPFSRGEKKDNQTTADIEKIDPLDAKALEFMDTDYEKLLAQASRLIKEKKYFQAAQYFLAYLKFKPDHATALYNLACCYGRLRRADLAVQCLVLAARAGFHNFALLKKDPDFIAVRNTPKFMMLMDRVSDWEDNLGETLYVPMSKLSELLVKVPDKIDFARRYPLLIGLHGNGGLAEKMIAIMNHALKKEPLILAAAQGAYPNFPQLRGRHFSWAIQTRERRLWKIDDPLAVQNIHEALQSLTRKYPISEVYLLGFSQGAAYAFLSAFKHADRVAGVISVGGVFPETDSEFSILKDEEIEKGKKFRVFIAQGTHDPLVAAGLGAQTGAKLKNYGYDVEYHEYEGGHEISPELLKKIYAWMIRK